MAPDDRDADLAGFRSHDELDEVLGSANPNPERIGCPPREVLAALARRQRPIADSGYEHLTRCSPCYRDFRRLQEEARRPSVSRAWIAAAAVVLLVLAGTIVFAVRRAGMGPQPPSPDAGAPQQQAVLDLRAYSLTRGSERNVEHPPLVLNRGNLAVSILLPVGSEPGVYELRLLDANLQPKLSKETVAEMKNFAATIATNLELRAVEPGMYQLAIRRQGGDWRLYQSRVE